MNMRICELRNTEHETLSDPVADQDIVELNKRPQRRASGNQQNDGGDCVIHQRENVECMLKKEGCRDDGRGNGIERVGFGLKWERLGRWVESDSGRLGVVIVGMRRMKSR